MKKTLTYSLLTLALVLASCQNNPNNSSSKPTSSGESSSSASVSVLPDNSSNFPDSSSPISSSGTSEEGGSSSSASSPVPNGTAKDVLSFLQKMASGDNYTLSIDYEDENGFILTDTVVYTDKYIYYSYSDAGYIEIEDYANSDSTLLYNFSGKANPVIENALSYTDSTTGEEIAIRDTKTMNPLVDGTKNLTEEDILINWDYFYSRDTTLIASFAYLVGASNLAGSMTAVLLEMNEDLDTLSFAFTPDFVSEDDTETIDSLNGKISLVGTSSVSSLDSFASTYTLPSVSLSDELLNSLSGKQAFDSTVLFCYEGNESDVIEQKDQVVVNESKRQIRRSVDELISSTFSLLTKDETTGHAMDNYIDYTGKVVIEDTEELFDDKVSQPKDLFEASAFRASSSESSTYTYYGYKATSFVNDLVDYYAGAILSVELTISDGKISKLHAISTTRYDSYGNRMHYDITVDFAKDYDFVELTDREEPSSSDEAGYALKRALSSVHNSYGLFNSFSAEIVTDTSSSNYKKTISVFKQKTSGYVMDTILIDQETLDSTGALAHVKTGYYDSGSGIIPFKIDSDGNAISTGATDTETKFGTLLGMDISSACFELESEDTETSVRTMKLVDGVKNISDHILGGNQKKYLLPSSLKVNVGKSGSLNVLTGLEYEFNGMDIYKGKEHVTFSNWGSTSMPESLNFATLTEWVEPTTWQTGAPEVYDKLKSAFGDKIDDVPFLYKKELEGNWGVDTYDDGTYIWASLFNDTYAATTDDVTPQYMQDYAALLKEKGFEEKKYPLANEGEGTQLYKDGIYVRVTDSAMAGIRFLIVK